MTDSTPRPLFRLPIIWIVGLVIVAFLVALAITSGGDEAPDEPTNARQTATITVEGAALPPLADPDPAIGTVVPTLTGSTADGRPLSIAPGTARVYGFFAHWCPHCQRELPELTSWLDDGLAAEGVEVVAVSTAISPDRDNYPPSAWFAEVGYPDDYLVDSPDSTAAQAFGLVAFPYWVVADGEGRVVLRLTGQVTEEQFITMTQLAAVGP